MAKVLGVGGVFFKSGDVPGLRAWYARVLGLEIGDWGAFFTASDVAAHPGTGTVLSLFKTDSTKFAPSEKDYMINLMVDDLDAILARCKAEGVTPLKVTPDEGLGPFAEIMDPDGRKIELWQPKEG